MTDSLNEQFSHIYDQYIDKIYRFIYLKVSSEEIAQDITSKVFIRGWEAFQNQIDPIKNPGAFLYQIARNAVIDHYRERGRTNIVSTDDTKEMADQKVDIQDKAMLSVDIDVIKKSIKRLGKEYQDIIIWHYLEDMSISEVAELAGRPEGTIRVMLHRGLKDLKDITKEF
jgi:RNA polymerase sigma-70 factor (ECF subfamily)